MSLGWHPLKAILKPRFGSAIPTLNAPNLIKKFSTSFLINIPEQNFIV
jgi:hypothetical protein